MKTGQQYKDSLKDSRLNLYYLGEKIDNLTQHPAIMPHINAVAATYDIAKQSTTLPICFREVMILLLRQSCCENFHRGQEPATSDAPATMP